MASKVRLDRLLVDRELAPSRERARALILAGSVEVNGMVVSKAGAQVDRAASVELKKADHDYVSRGALKLEAALGEFSPTIEGVVAMDVGASTGGFTDLLLRHGARKVYAIDVGYGQLAWSLRQDDRVVVLERENIRHLDPTRIPDPVDLAVVDVSFISLTLVLGKIADLMGPPGGKPIIALVKPQFEAGKDQVGKGGVVRDEAVRLATVHKVQDWARAAGFGIGGVVESPIHGPAGNVEYLIELATPDKSASRLSQDDLAG